MGLKASCFKLIAMGFFALLSFYEQNIFADATDGSPCYNTCYGKCSNSQYNATGDNATCMQHCEATYDANTNPYCLSYDDPSASCKAEGKTWTVDADGNGSCGASTAAAIDPCTTLTAQMQICQTDAASTTNSCNANSNPGLSAISSMAQSLGSSTAASVESSCSKIASVVEGADAALAAYRLNCASSASSCSTDCQAALNTATANPACGTTQATVNQLMQQCTAGANNAQSAQTAITNYAMTLNNASSCATATSITDCTNPAMSGNVTCICATNPNSSACVTATAANSNITAYPDSASRQTTAAVVPDTGDDSIPLGTATPAPTDTGVDGKQGGGAQLGGDPSTGKPNTPGAAGAAAAGGAPAVTAGFYGSGGGLGGGGGGSGSSAAAGGLMAGLAKMAKGIDLRSFLPGGKLDPNRGIAGASGPDGITGPNSDIWQKIQNRYRSNTPTLLP